MKKRKKGNSSGLTLVELLLSTAIMAFAIAGTMGVFFNCLFLNSANSNLAIAESHAQYVLENIKNADFAGVRSNIDNGVWNYDAAGINGAGLTALNGETIVTTHGTAANPLDIIVTVQWRDKFNRNRDVFLETMIEG
ncbi:MAG: type IV pilus modification PilV family protein [Deltaproteobacteria bacterium]